MMQNFIEKKKKNDVLFLLIQFCFFHPPCQVVEREEKEREEKERRGKRKKREKERTGSTAFFSSH